VASPCAAGVFDVDDVGADRPGDHEDLVDSIGFEIGQEMFEPQERPTSKAHARPDLAREASVPLVDAGETGPLYAPAMTRCCDSRLDLPDAFGRDAGE
jgi:hypothetical protein